MKEYHVLKNRLWRPAINLDKLWSLVTEQHREVYQKKTDVAPVIDVVRAVNLSYSIFSILIKHRLSYFSF
jgi:hypothetical protein